MTQFVAYYRVSTDRQGSSGLGLDAQRTAVLRHVQDGKLTTEYTEVESGKKHTNRPQLLAALTECRKRRAILVIAKLDRLGRNVAFISALMESAVEFVCCDNPFANRLMLHMLAAFAEHEAAQISLRTRVALAAAKARGVRLGNPRWVEALQAAQRVSQSRKPGSEVVAMMQGFRAQGLSYRAIARELNRLNVKTYRGCAWFGVTVKATLVHLANQTSTSSVVRSQK
jgi:DNA invertase Pin-like site-specific DNA recombinase